MSERLLIRLHGDGHLSWLALNTEGRALSASHAGVPSAQAIARAQRTVVLVPAEDVLLLDTPAMNVSRVQFSKAVPFALEDQLVTPVEDLHVAFPDRLSGERVPVAVVARDTLRGWIETLAREGIRVDAMIAETQAMPFNAEKGSVLIEPERTLWRSAETQAGVCDTSTLTEWIETATAGDEKKRSFDAFDFRPLPATIAVHPLIRHRPNQTDALAFLAAQLGKEPQVNLLQGDFAPAHLQAPARRVWRVAAVLGAAALALLFLYFGLDNWRLSRQSARLESAARDVLHSAFPELDKVVGSPRDLMQSSLGALRGGGDTGPIHLLSQIAPLLTSTTRTSLLAIEYHNGTLEIALRAPDVPTLDLMRERIATVPGLKVEVTSANSGTEGVDGRLRIAGAKP